MEIKGAFLYQGLHTTQQVENIKDFFEQLLEKENFDIIIELGTSFGGLTYIIDDIVKEKRLTHNIHTFDFSYKPYVNDYLVERGCVYYTLDEREEIYKETVVGLLKNNGKSLLLCDGGNKVQEFNRYSEFLKPGDVIMAHDYCYDLTTFEKEIKNKFWNWFEISFLDISDSVKNYNLDNYKSVDFKNAAWACFQKK